MNYCSVCGEPLELALPAMKGRLVPRSCSCVIRERDRIDQLQRSRRHDDERRRCFTNIAMARWAFEYDDRRDARISDALQAYVQQFDAHRRTGKGLLLHGRVGTGKSFYAGCIANALINAGYTARYRNFSQLANELQDAYGGKTAVIDRMTGCDLLLIDDLGAERSTSFMGEVVFSVIDARLNSGLPMILTTNLALEELKHPADDAGARIYDRVLQACHPISIDGPSRRRESVRASFPKMQKDLGLDA